jgi:Mn2+/Fe2+ NRAMP family transporter
LVGTLNACIAGFALLCYVLGLLVSQQQIPLMMNVIFPKLSGESAYSLMALLGKNIMAHNFYIHSSVFQVKFLFNAFWIFVSWTHRTCVSSTKKEDIFLIKLMLQKVWMYDLILFRYFRFYIGTMLMLSLSLMPPAARPDKEMQEKFYRAPVTNGT